MLRNLANLYMYLSIVLVAVNSLSILRFQTVHFNHCIHHSYSYLIKLLFLLSHFPVWHWRAYAKRLGLQTCLPIAEGTQKQRGTQNNQYGTIIAYIYIIAKCQCMCAKMHVHCTKPLPIMLPLCLMLLPPYYTQCRIIGSSLLYSVFVCVCVCTRTHVWVCACVSLYQ